MNTLKKVAVIVPFYQNKISALENIALVQLAKILAPYPRIAIKPHSLVLSDEIKQFNFTEVQSFDDSYFESIQGYNTLMLSDKFYERFLNCEYILIHQLDAFVFKDELNEWCSRDLDYIGAPWIRKDDYPDMIKALKSKWQYYFHTRFNVQKNGLPSPMQFENRVGNGGFSLRRVKLFHELCNKMQDQIKNYLGRNEHQFHEDTFWSIEVNRKRKLLKIPSSKTGLRFSIELNPVQGLKINNNELPFGCHAWDKNIDFWRPFFKACGYEI
jgi:hypothetical protein